MGDFDGDGYSDLLCKTSEPAGRTVALADKAGGFKVRQ